MRQSRRRKTKYGLQFVRFTRHSTVIILANLFRLHARIVFQKFHFTYCDILHCDTTVRYLRIELLNISYANEREGKEKERNGEKPEKHSRKGWKKSPRWKTLSRSRPTRSQRMVLSPSSFLPLLRGQTRLSRYPSRAAASSFASSRRRSHPRRRVPEPENPPFPSGDQDTPPPGTRFVSR